ncbi:hypothetical protein [Microbacterium sp. 1P06AB]|uniref:hypothetical protein n=1 Tax=Microbacterium sp. 1P06AB TaxID=3132289 RepID=UPI0039A50FA6
MSASRSARAVGVFLAAGCVAAVCAACSPAVHHGERQSVASACEAVATAVDDAMTAFADADATDPSTAANATASVRAQLEELAPSIHNARVADVVADLRSGFDVLATATSAAADGDLDGVTGLGEATDRIRSGVSEYHDLCAR